MNLPLRAQRRRAIRLAAGCSSDIFVAILDGERRREPARPDGAPAYDAWLESFVPAEEVTLAVGDHVLLLVETSNERYPVTVQTIEAGGSVVSIYWTADELPAPLRGRRARLVAR